ncbi:hypothetical protein ES319_D01G182900v1 [Gossypium barbadense]|uniref:Uncharacterized protein n=1 Tax=Gossypium barbadense TaxID=3634 RepID=A0A5J5SQ18_GOSBA|nr:hypothetical protein ES319_D01G182900v1 [Gossypium barbadense]
METVFHKFGWQASGAFAIDLCLFRWCCSVHCKRIFDPNLLKKKLIDTELAKELYKKYSAIHRRKICAWKMICVLSQFVDDDIVGEVTRCLQIALYVYSRCSCWTCQ